MVSFFSSLFELFQIMISYCLWVTFYVCIKCTLGEVPIIYLWWTIISTYCMKRQYFGPYHCLLFWSFCQCIIDIVKFTRTFVYTLVHVVIADNTRFNLFLHLTWTHRLLNLKSVSCQGKEVSRWPFQTWIRSLVVEILGFNFYSQSQYSLHICTNTNYRTPKALPLFGHNWWNPPW